MALATDCSIPRHYLDPVFFPETKVAMTVPVSTWVSLTPEGTEEFREMAFFLGNDHQADPPKPTNEKVFINERPGVTVFTRY